MATAIRRPVRTPALRIERLSKTFGATKALDDVTIAFDRGQTHALVGSNGSGKSTLIKTLAGYHRPDPGAHAYFAGEEFDLEAPGDERPAGLRFIHQDLGLVLELSAVDNFGLKCGFSTSRGFVSWREQARRTREAIARFDLGLDVHAPLSQATPVERTIVAIAAAIQDWDEDGGLLVLDEPTAALPPVEVTELFAILDEVKAAGATIVYVSHRLDEIFQICSDVSVLRAGRLVASRAVEGLVPQDIAALMVGTDVDTEIRPTRPVAQRRDLALEARGLRGEFLRGVDLQVGHGEIVGVAGLLGSGREELPYVVAGARADIASGRLRVGDGEWSRVESGGFRHPIVPADRLREGIVGEMTIEENLALPVLSELGRGGLLRRGAERDVARESIRRVDLVPPEPDRVISTLSGGNQQKVVVARWLTEQRPLLILAEPTAGVDIAARMALFRLLIAEADRGLGVLVSSSDVDDLLHLCTRVLVLRDGVVARELAYDEITETNLLHAMEGIDS